MNDTFMTILLMSLTGSALAIFLFLLKPIIRNHVSKAFLYYIWLPVLLRLIVPFGFAVNVAYETPPAPSIAPVSFESNEPAIKIPIPENAVPVLPGDTGGPFTVAVTEHETQTPSIAEAAPTAVTETDAAPKAEEKFDFVQFLLDSLGYIWLAGAVVSFGWYLISYAVFYRRLSRSFASPSMADLEVFNSMRRTGNVRLVTSAEAKTPMHMGAFYPVIVLPQIDYTASGMEKELRDVLRHELTHWRRHDILYKWFVVLVQSVHWFNPVVYFIHREIDKSCELSCDEAVVRGLSEQERISYGNTLLALASERAIPRRIPATTLSEGKKQLKERIISIRDYKKSTRTMVALMLVMAIVLTGCATAIAAVGTDTAQQQKAEPASISGWIYGDDAVLTYVMEHYNIDGKKIVNGTYQETGHRDGGDYKRYTVGTEDGGTYLLTANGELKPHYFLFHDTGRRGPEFRVNGISFTAHYESYSPIKQQTKDRIDLTGITGANTSVEAYITSEILRELETNGVSYYKNSGGETTAQVTDTEISSLRRTGSLNGLSPDGVLESWHYSYRVKLDATDVNFAGGMSEQDGWYDLEGQGGHDVVALRYPNGRYDILYDAPVNDGGDFYGYHNSYEEAIYDWYVTEYGLNLPLYVEDWSSLVADYPAGNLPVHRFDGDGWYVYIPVAAWEKTEGVYTWTSGYGTGSSLTVQKLTAGDYSWRALPPAEGVDDRYFETDDGGSWHITTQYIPENITDYPEIAVEPDVLRLMAESFTVITTVSSDNPTPTTPASQGGSTEIFTINNLTIEVTGVLGISTATFTDDMAETHEYPVYICAPGAVATVYGADMDDPAYAEDKKAHAQWAFYTETWERADIVDGMAPVTVFKTLTVCHIESSTPVLKLEIPIKDRADEDAVTHAASVGDRTLTVEAVGRERVDGISGWGVGTLNIYDGDNLIQTLSLSEAIGRDGVSGPIASGYTEAWDRESAFYTQDINFDGKDDIVVMGWIPNNTIPYYCYLWNSDRGEYEYAFILQGLSVDPEKKEVVSEYHTSGENYEYRYDHYQYDEAGKLVLVDRVVG